MFADAIVMPVCNSVFDRESAADCFAELMTLPRVASGRCKVAAVGMRLDARTKADEVLRDWAAKHGIPFIGVLRETQGYVRCVEQGLTLFDLPPAKVETDLTQWQPILQWLRPVLHAAPAAAAVARPVDQAGAAARSRPPAESLRPAHTGVIDPGVQLATIARMSPSRPAPAGAGSMADRVGRWLGTWGVARLLQR
jgi:chromosome partitioning protein